MKSIFNFRPLFVIFLGIILGATYYISIANICNKYWLGLFIVITLFLSVLIVYIILGLLNKKSKFMVYLHSTYMVWLTLFVTVILFGAIFSMAVAIKNSRLPQIDGKVSYSGIITQMEVCDNYVNVELRNVEYDNTKLNSNLKVIIYTKGNNNFEIGDKLFATGVIDKVDTSGYAKFNYSAIYKTSANKVTIEDGKPNLFESIKESVRELLYSNMNNENAGIGVAMLFGEKDSIDDNITNVFSISGISHILAVSGLHIGVLVGALFLILRICNANNHTFFGVISGTLLFYMILCGFSPSVVRASIMSIVLLGEKCYGKRYDNLSALSLAGILISLFNPFALFSIGFQLSFACVFAIITLMPTINRFFEYIHFSNKFSSALSVSISTSIALIPFCANYFGRISLLSVLTNVVVIPIFSFAYILLFVLAIIGLLLKFVGVLLIVPDVLIHLIKLIANFVATVPYSYVLVFDVSIITFVLVFAIQYVLEFMLCTKFCKLIVLGVLAICTVISMVFDFMPKKYNDNMIIHFNQYYGNMAIITHDNNEITLIGYNSKDMARLKNILNEYRINKLDNIVLYNSNFDIDEFNAMVFDYKVSNIYISIDMEIGDINSKIIRSEKFTIDDISFEFVLNKGIAIDTTNGYRIIGEEFERSDLVYISNKYYDDIYSISVSRTIFDYANTVDYNEIILQESGEFNANIVLNNQKIWYSNI